MQWRVTLEAIDPSGDKYRGEFSFDKKIGRLQDGELGYSLEDGKTVMAEIQRIVVQREIGLYLECRRVCLDCHSTRQVKDRRTRKIETVFGSVEVESPRYRVCQKCHPYTDFTSTPVCEIVPNRATLELIRLSAKLGALMPYRQAADVLSTFLPDQTAKRFVKKQQMRWSPQSANSLLAVRAAVLNNELKKRMSYAPPTRKPRPVNACEYQPHLPLTFAA